MNRKTAVILTIANLAGVLLLTQMDWSQYRKNADEVMEQAKGAVKKAKEAMTPKITSPVQELGSCSPYVAQSTHVKIVKTGVFWDDNAYEHKRCSYKITDLETGRTYLGVSGIGIVETGSHSDGETNHVSEK